MAPLFSIQLSLSDALSVLMAAQNIQKKKVMIYSDLLCTNSFQRGCFVFAMSHLQKEFRKLELQHSNQTNIQIIQTNSIQSKQTNGKRFEYVNKQLKTIKRYFGRVDF